MKKLMKSLVLFAAAAMALTSCENEAMNEGIEANDTYTMNFVAGAPESKTSVSVVDNKATFSWAAKDEPFYFVQNTADGLKKGTNVSFKNNDGVAEITATFTEKNSPIVAVYPEAAWVSNSDDFNKAKLIVKKDQDLTANTFAPDADLMVSKVVNPENVTDTHLLQFTRLVAVGKMTLKNLNNGEIIEKVNFSIDSENALTGRLYIDLATGKVSEWGYYNNAEKSVELVNGSMATDVANGNDIYFTCMPATIAAGEKFTVKVTTNKTIYTHSVTIPEGKSIDFTSGRVSAFSVNMASATREDNKAIALPWSEGFDSEDLSAYTIVNGGSTTKVYPEDNSAKGANAGEILISKGDGSMTATIASDGTAKTLNLWFKSNNPSYISVSSATEGVTITKLTNTGYTVALAEGVSTFKLTLANTNTSSNARVDDITLTEEAPAIEKLTIEGATLSFTAGDTFATGEDFTVKAVYQNGVTETVTGYKVDSNAVNMSAPDTYTVTVTYNGVVATYDVTVQAADVKTETATITLSDIYTSTTKFTLNTEYAWGDFIFTYTTQKSSQNQTQYNSSYIRFYGSDVFTIKHKNGYTITAATFTCSNSYATALTFNGVEDTDATWTGSTEILTVKNHNSKQVRFNKVAITYEVSGGGGGGTTPEPEPEEPTELVMSDIMCSAQTDTSLTFTWTAVANATEYQIYFDGADKGTTTELSYVATGLTAGSTHTIAVKAVGDGVNYTTSSTAKTVQGTTTNTQQGGGSETEGGSITYTFSGISSVQYAEETHTLDDVLTMDIKGCHMNTQLRIYGGQNGVAIGKLTNGATIESLGFNMGYKADYLIVSGSTDGSTWTEVGSIATATSYKDYTLDFGATNYTYFKLEVKGSSQIRIASLTLNYK